MGSAHCAVEDVAILVETYANGLIFWFFCSNLRAEKKFNIMTCKVFRTSRSGTS